MLSFGVYFYVLLFLATGAVHAEISCNCAQPDKNYTDVNLIYYYCNGTNISFPIGNPQGLLNVTDVTKQTVFYIFGWTQTPQTLNVTNMIKALCYKNATYNVMLLDWSVYSASTVPVGEREATYPLTAIDAMNIGVLFSDCLKKLKDNNFNTDMVYIVAHSMGAIIAGTTGKCTQKKHSFIIPRITGLDPSNPTFDAIVVVCHLSSKDAKCVDVIHTDMAVAPYLTGYGTPEKCGTADYYPNCGIRYQPGCRQAILFSDEDFCSHHYSLEFYIEMIYHPKKFIRLRCYLHLLDLFLYLFSTISDNRVGYTACDVEGDFYFNTTES